MIIVHELLNVHSNIYRECYGCEKQNACILKELSIGSRKY